MFVAALHFLILTTDSALSSACYGVTRSSKEEGLSDNDLWEMQLHFPYSVLTLLHPTELVHWLFLVTQLDAKYFEETGELQPTKGKT